MYSKLRERYKIFGSTVEEDAIYENKLVNLFVNRVLRNGKKTLARKFVWNSIIKIGTFKDCGGIFTKQALSCLELAVRKVAPQIEFKSPKARFGKKTYPVPIEIRSYRSVKVAIKWVVEAARHFNKDVNNFSDALLGILTEAAQNKGCCIKKKKKLHKRARKTRRKKYRKKRINFSGPK